MRHQCTQARGVPKIPGPWPEKARTTGPDGAAPQTSVETVIRVTDAVTLRMPETRRDLCEASFNGTSSAVRGVTFKPNTDDMPDAPSLPRVPARIGGGASARAVDPQEAPAGACLGPSVTWCTPPYAAAQEADLRVRLTQWTDARALDLARRAAVMACARLADCRDIYSAHELKGAGSEACETVGRAPLAAASRITPRPPLDIIATPQASV